MHTSRSFDHIRSIYLLLLLLSIIQGIVFSVRPPKKSWKHIANLSGGEKTLSSLSLVFALHHYKPTPLYVMDEIDAALDFKNVSIGECWDQSKSGQCDQHSVQAVCQVCFCPCDPSGRPTADGTSLPGRVLLPTLVRVIVRGWLSSKPVIRYTPSGCINHGSRCSA